jgi:predicted nucleic acid-binding Zn ribbon protein
MALSIAIKELRDFLKEIAGVFSQRFDETAGHCPNCSAPYLREEIYCYHCGEQKANQSRDTTFYALLMELLVEILVINRRLFFTIIGLICRPGLLTRAYFLGIRNKFYKPLTILSAVVGIFYGVFASATLFHTGFNEMDQAYQQGWNTSNFLHYDIAGQARLKSETIHRDVKDIIKDTEQKAEVYSKNFFWLIWPLLAVFVSMLVRQQHLNFNYHLVSAAHIFGAYLVAWLLICLITFKVAHVTAIQPVQSLYLNIIFLIYMVFHLRIAYRLTAVEAIWRGLILAAVFFGLIIIFRQATTLISFLTINR